MYCVDRASAAVLLVVSKVLYQQAACTSQAFIRMSAVHLDSVLRQHMSKFSVPSGKIIRDAMQVWMLAVWPRLTCLPSIMLVRPQGMKPRSHIPMIGLSAFECCMSFWHCGTVEISVAHAAGKSCSALSPNYHYYQVMPSSLKCVEYSGCFRKLFGVWCSWHGYSCTLCQVAGWWGLKRHSSNNISETAAQDALYCPPCRGGEVDSHYMPKEVKERMICLGPEGFEYPGELL